MLQRLICLLALLGFISCVDPANGGATGDTALYAYDNAAKVIYRWDDLPGAFTAGALPAPSTTLSTTLLNAVTPLAWGGLAFDDSRNRLYLVGEGGDVLRLDRVRNLTGSVSSADAVSFTLDSSQRLTSSKFGQAAVDSATDTLYVTENGDNGTRIWMVSGASSRLNNETVTAQYLQTSGDSGGFGVAAGQGLVFGSFQNGNAVGTDSLTGPRLRKGASGAFVPSSVILGDLTGLGKFATLALDKSNSLLYVGMSLADDGTVSVPVGVFQTGQLGGVFNQAPHATLGSAKAIPDLRVLAHPGAKDWLAGLSGSGSALVWVWKSPSGSSPAFLEMTAPSGAELRGLALDGNP